jgi:hypothetical protein
MSIQTITTPSGTYTVELPQGWTRARALKVGEVIRKGTYVLPISGEFRPCGAHSGETIQPDKGYAPIAYPEGYYFVDDPTPANDLPSEDQILRVESLTHSGTFPLSNGANLSIARGPKGWVLMGEWNGHTQIIAFSNEAMEVIAETVMADGINLIPILKDLNHER